MPQNDAGRIVEPLVWLPTAAGRAARRACGIVRIGGRARAKVGELRRNRLAQDNRAGFAQARDQKSVFAGFPAGVEDRAVLGGKVGGIDDVLDADRHAVERTDRQASHTERVGALCELHRVIRVQVRPCADRILAFLDTPKASAHQVPGRDRALADSLGGLGGTDKIRFHPYGPNRNSGSQRAIPGKLYISTMAKMTIAR